MRRRWTVIVFGFAVALFVALLTPRVVQVQGLKARSANLEKEIAALRKQNLLLEHELKLLREDPVYLEKVAREKFNKAKQGEIVYKVVRE